MRSLIDAALAERAAHLQRIRDNRPLLDAVEDAGERLSHCLASGGRVWACGNGGSMADAMHLCEELSGSFRAPRDPLPAVAFADPAHLTCVANDFGYEEVFARSVAGHVRAGDVLVALSTSGASPNVVRAAVAAREREAVVVALTGRPGSALGAAADIDLCCEAGRWSDGVQELHMTLIHLLVELVEHRLFPEHTAHDGAVTDGPPQAG